MLIPHEFVADGHFYKPKGLLEWCFATSDVLELNGLSDFNQVPPKALDHAALRGTITHRLIECAEMALEASVEDLDTQAGKEATDRLEGYFRFKEGHSIRLAGPMERTMVYRHQGTEQLIGVTPDMPVFISCDCKALYCPLRGLQDALAVVDLKTQHKQYGAKLEQLKLKWWAQTQSQVEALEADDLFWKQIRRPTAIEKIVLHLHPECGKIRGAAPLGFEVHRFKEDGQFLWDGMIRVAQAKLAHGYKLNRFLPKTQEVPLEIGNANYQAPEDCAF